MLMKMTPGVDFINVQQQDTDDLTVFFALFGSTSVKAVRITLMKLTPDAPKVVKNKLTNNMVLKLLSRTTALEYL